MRAGNAILRVDGRVLGTGLVKPLLAAMVDQNGSPDATAQKLDDYLAAQVPPRTRPRAEHDRDAELYRGMTEPSMGAFARGIADYLQPKVAVAIDADQDVYPVLNNFFYVPAGGLTASRTVRITYASPSAFNVVSGRNPDGSPIVIVAPYSPDDLWLIDGDFVLIRNDSSQSLSVTVQPHGKPLASLTTVAAGGWIVAMQILGTWRVLAGS